MTSQNAKTPADIYNDFFGPAMFSPWAKDLVAQAPPAAGDYVLDLACGTGLVSEQIAPLIGDTGSIVALDFNPIMLAVARKRDLGATKAEWIEASADSIPLPDNSIDAVYCQQGFQFFPDRAKAASEVGRVLKPGGKLAVAVWASSDEFPVWKALFTSASEQINVPIEALSIPNSFGGPEPLANMFTDAGFSNVQINKRSKESAFAPADAFVKLMVMGAAAAIPAFAELTDEEKQALEPKVRADTAKIVQEHTDNGRVVMQTISYTAIGTA